MKEVKSKTLAITGSNGKTTVKEMIGSLLDHQNTVLTKDNENNEFGIAYTVLKIDKNTENLILECGARKAGDFDLIVYESEVNGTEHVAVIKGDISNDEPVLVRMHAMNILDDTLRDIQNSRAGELEMSLRMIAEEGRGAAVLIRDSWNARFSNQVNLRKADWNAKQKISEGLMKVQTISPATLEIFYN